MTGRHSGISHQPVDAINAVAPVMGKVWKVAGSIPFGSKRMAPQQKSG
jgi:hypothetical protein